MKKVYINSERIDFLFVSCCVYSRGCCCLRLAPPSSVLKVKFPLALLQGTFLFKMEKVDVHSQTFTLITITTFSGS